MSYLCKISLLAIGMALLSASTYAHAEPEETAIRSDVPNIEMTTRLRLKADYRDLESVAEVAVKVDASGKATCLPQSDEVDCSIGDEGIHLSFPELKSSEDYVFDSLDGRLKCADLPCDVYRDHEYDASLRPDWDRASFDWDWDTPLPPGEYEVVLLGLWRDIEYEEPYLRDFLWGVQDELTTFLTVASSSSDTHHVRIEAELSRDFFPCENMGYIRDERKPNTLQLVHEHANWDFELKAGETKQLQQTWEIQTDGSLEGVIRVYSDGELVDFETISVTMTSCGA